jgi:hypothetical protein
MQHVSQFASDWWAFMVIGGPILLGLVLAYGVVQSKKRRSRRIDALSAGIGGSRMSTDPTEPRA